MSNKVQLELREFVAGHTDVGLRLDIFLSSRCSDLSRARVQSLIDDGNVMLGQQLAKRSYKMQFGDEATLRVPPPEIALAIPQDLPINVVYEDKDEIKLIGTMKKASRLMIIGMTDKNDQTTDHYSMMGFTKAYNTAKKSCS